MGEPVGDEYPPGVNCPVCWGLGKTFGIGNTPEKVYITWTNLPGGWAAGNKIFIAIQRFGFSCFWDFNDGNFVGWWTFQAITTAAQISSPGGGPPHYNLLGLPCVTVLTDGVAKCVIS